MPRLSDEIRKDLFFTSLRKRLTHLYSYGESHPDERPTIKANVEGFFESAICMKVVTRDEVQRAIDELHLQIFGMTRAERRRMTGEPEGQGEPDWSVYDRSPLSRK